MKLSTVYKFFLGLVLLLYYACNGVAIYHIATGAYARAITMLATAIIMRGIYDSNIQSDKLEAIERKVDDINKKAN